MTKKGSQELREYRTELRNIISELKNLEHSIRYNFKNVGNDKCADSICFVIGEYELALEKLNSVDASVLDTLKKAAEDAKAALSN